MFASNPWIKWPYTRLNLTHNLTLLSTLNDLYNSNQRSLVDLDLLRIINIVAPRNWFFSLTAPNQRQIDINFYTDPILTAEETKEILSGPVSKIFDTQTIQYTNSTEFYECVLKKFDRKLNILEFLSVNNEENNGISLIGFGSGSIPPSYQNNSEIIKFLTEQTWLGSHFLPRNAEDFQIKWSVLGNLSTFETKKRYPSNVVAYEKSFPIENNGEFNLKFSSGTKNEQITVHHSLLGPINLPNQYLKKFRDLRFFPNFEFSVRPHIEIQENDLKYEANGNIGPYDPLCKILDNVRAKMEEHLESRDFINFKNHLENKRRKQETQKLNDRITRIQNREKVCVNGKVLCCEPKCEQEVLNLLAKLETLEQLPLKCFLLKEYTPKLGIDAIADIQISDVGFVQNNVPVELEVFYENYEKHNHSLDQTFMIICWKFRNSNAREAFNLDGLAPGLYKKRTREGSDTYVLVLSECDALQTN